MAVSSEIEIYVHGESPVSEKNFNPCPCTRAERSGLFGCRNSVEAVLKIYLGKLIITGMM